jgi:hypothetical protein
MASYFAINTGSYLPGTTQLGNLVITDNPNTYPGFTWWAAVSNNIIANKYVICRQVPLPRLANSQIPNVTVNFGFLGSEDKTDASYLSLVNQVSGQTFVVVQNATNWLNANGYWTSEGTSNATDILTDGLVLQVDASNPSSYSGTGTTWFDLSGNDYDGVLTNGASYSSDFGGVISFTGSISQYVTFGDPIETRLTSSNAVTYQIWVRAESGSTGNVGIIPTFNKLIYNNDFAGITTEMYLLGADTTPGNDGIYSYVNYANPGTSGDMEASSTTTGTTMTTGSWYFISVTAQLGATIGTLYNNNQLYDSQKGFDYVPNFENSASLELGRSYNEPITVVGPINSYLNGEIGAFYIYDRQLSQAEVTNNFNVTKARYGY